MTTDVETEQKKNDASWFAVLGGAILAALIVVFVLIVSALTIHATAMIFGWAWDLIG